MRQAVHATLNSLELGELRVAEQDGNGDWITNEWLKKTVLLTFKMWSDVAFGDSALRYFDRVPTQFKDFGDEDFAKRGFRLVPPASVRAGSHIASGVVVMPSFVNIGAFVDSGTMVDTWATVGSCAQIGKNVHLSGGVGIGGVLEPLQSTPTIIEDDCFIGARSEIVEGVIVGKGSAVSMGVYIGKSTKIYNRETKEISYGKVPPGSVVVPGSLPAKDGSHSVYCAVIVKQVDEKTKAKVALNEMLRIDD